MKLELPIDPDRVEHFQKFVDAKLPVAPVLVSAKFDDGTRTNYTAYPLHIKITHGMSLGAEASMVFEVAKNRPSPEPDRKIEELQAQVAKMRKALEEIAKVRRGLDMTDTDEYRADYFFRQVDCYQDLARKALRGPSPA